ncbi:MAG: YHS domain-containing (seleno)protein [Pseudomonadota bacterium]
MNYDRRKIGLASAAFICTGGVAIVAATNGFGLLPKEYEANPVFVKNGFAIRGYDPVAYFEYGEPQVGQSNHRYTWHGATWLFASELHKDMFAERPKFYAPQYGGFCAWAVAVKGKLYSTQATNWKIVNQRLYLNYNDAIQKKWAQDEQYHIALADERWPKMINDLQG